MVGDEGLGVSSLIRFAHKWLLPGLAPHCGVPSFEPLTSCHKSNKNNQGKPDCFARCGR